MAATEIFPSVREHIWLMLKWLAWVAPLAIVTGAASAFFAWSLDRATTARFEHPWLLYLLPLGGMLSVWMYQRSGKTSDGGNNLILEQIHEPGGGVPRRMAPLVLFATLLTHLLGGSGGREGTAAQMGGSFAGGFGRWWKLKPDDFRVLLMAGVAAGFSAIFGTPFAGTIFALEVVAIGQIRHAAVIPCLAAALIGNWTCLAFGIAHTRYDLTFRAQELIPSHAGHFEGTLVLKILLASVLFGLAGAGFATASRVAQQGMRQLCPQPLLRPVIGGVAIIALVHLLGTRQYLGLGVWSPNPADLTLPSLFGSAGTVHSAWFWKMAFTLITLSTGFKGGEVTPLFFIGAALGNSLAALLGAPVDLFAALGFVAIFAAASNTPLACAVMGIELFGAANAHYLALACFVAWRCSGRSSIYLSQR